MRKPISKLVSVGVSGAALTLVFSLLMGVALTGTANVSFLVNADLQADGDLVRQRRLPVLLVFTADHCAYCELLEREILRPMVISGDYEDRVIIRKINLDRADQLRDFDGQAISVDQVVQRYNVFVTPTLVFVNGRGEELAERLVGINTVEMFGGLVDAAIEESLLRLRQDATAAAPLTTPL